MRVAMIGTGYVGLVSGACFADFGHEVICVDKDTGKIAALTRGEVPIFVPGLNDLVAANTRAGRLQFTNDLPGAVKAADAVFIAVGTPSRRGDGHADLTYVYDAVDPVGMEQAKPMMTNVTFCDDAYSCAEGASALVIVTEWEQFRALDFARLKTIMASPVLVDLRNIYRPEEVARHGFVYESVGRKRGKE